MDLEKELYPDEAMSFVLSFRLRSLSSVTMLIQASKFEALTVLSVHAEDDTFDVSHQRQARRSQAKIWLTRLFSG